MAMRCFFFFLLIAVQNAYSQSFPCYPAPEVNFSGTPIVMHYTVEDTLFPQDVCYGVVSLYQQHEFIVPIVETEFSYIGIFSNRSSGVVLNAWDKSTDTLLWQQIYNHTNTNLQRAYGITSARWLGGDTLSLKGHRSWSVYEGNIFPSALYGGLISNRKISLTDGAIISDNFKGDDYHIYADLIAYNNMDQPVTVKGTNIFHTMGFYQPVSDTASIVGLHSYVDSVTHKRYLNWAPYNDFPPQGSADYIWLKDFGPNGEKASFVTQYGPMQVTDSTKTYLLRFNYGNAKNYMGIVEMDNWGNFIEYRNVTDELSKDIESFIWDFKKVDRINDNLYKIDGIIPSDNPELWSQGEKRYIVIDGYGNLIRERQVLEIDGMKPLFWRSKLLSNGNLLHVFRPVENNNLYLYEEYQDGSYRKAGELINHGDPFYAFHPKQIDQMSNGDIFIKNYVAIDTVWQLEGFDQNFNLGGWGVMLKINAEELGLQVHTEEVIASTQINIYPNPATEEFRIDIEAEHYPIDVDIYDLLAREVYSDRLYHQSDVISVRSWSSGLYHLRIRDKSGAVRSGRLYKE